MVAAIFLLSVWPFIGGVVLALFLEAIGTFRPNMKDPVTRIKMRMAARSDSKRVGSNAA